MAIFFSILISILSVTSAFALAPKASNTTFDTELGTFSGRVSALNGVGQLLRVRVDFKNSKFINKRDRIEFWNETNTSKRCTSIVVGKSPEYILLKIPSYQLCVKQVHLTVGSYLLFFSQDLEKNVQIAKELVGILIKKRVATESKLKRTREELDSYIEKTEAVNKRYQVLREKLENEWKKELFDLEEDKNISYQNFKSAEATRDDIDLKLEQYRVYDENLQLDRWSLDPRLYKKK